MSITLSPPCFLMGEGKIVSWATGTAKQITTMITLANNGELTLSDYWTPGEEVNANTVADIAANDDYMKLVCSNDLSLAMLCSSTNSVEPIRKALQNYRETIINTLNNSALFARTTFSSGRKHQVGTQFNQNYGTQTNSFYIPYQYTIVTEGSNGPHNAAVSDTANDSNYDTKDHWVWTTSATSSGAISKGIAIRGTYVSSYFSYISAYIYTVK